MKDFEYYLLFDFMKADQATHLSLVERELPGGKITRAELDRIQQFPRATEISVSGLRQDTFEYFIRRYGRQFKAINFWKCPLVTDLTPLESLPEIEYIVYFWNQRAERLWDISQSRSLKGLGFDDFTRMHDLSDLARAPHLQELHFGNKVWNKYVLDTLEPVGQCARLKHLTFSAQKIADGRIEPLAHLTALQRFDFPSNQFTTSQVAWLKARLPEGIDSNVLRGYWTINNPVSHDGKDKDTVVVGKGKPWLLDSKRDKRRLDRSIDEFHAMHQWFLGHPDASPEQYREAI